VPPLRGPRLPSHAGPSPRAIVRDERSRSRSSPRQGPGARSASRAGVTHRRPPPGRARIPLRLGCHRLPLRRRGAPHSPSDAHLPLAATVHPERTTGRAYGVASPPARDTPGRIAAPPALRELVRMGCGGVGPLRSGRGECSREVLAGRGWNITKTPGGDSINRCDSRLRPPQTPPTKSGKRRNKNQHRSGNPAR